MQGIVERGSDTSSGCSSAGVSNIDSGKGPGWGDLSSEPVSPQTEFSTSPTTPTEDSNRGKPVPIIRLGISSHPSKSFTLSSFGNAAPYNNGEIKKDLDSAIYLEELSSQGEVSIDSPTSGFHTKISQMISFHPNLRKESEISDCSNVSKTDSVFASSDSTVEIPVKRDSQRFPVMSKEAPKDNYGVSPQKNRVMGRSECSPLGWPSVLNKTRSKFACSKNIKQQCLTAVGQGDTVEMNCSEDGGSSTSGSFRINTGTSIGTVFSDIYPSVNV